MRCAATGGEEKVVSPRSEALIRIRSKRAHDSHTVNEIERWSAKDFLNGKYGRLGDVVVSLDGFLYFLTSNRNGKGEPREDDDEIYRILPR
jgi:glucose/arabinose dehydrogenase